MIVVLTLGRSGSSLLMQTLRTLGAEVIGRDFDEGKGEAHHQGNPGGYLEDPEIFYRGPETRAFQELPDDAVCKMDLRHLVDPGQTTHWLAAADRIQALLISYRQPSEQAQSEFAGPSVTGATPERFAFITDFLRRYVETFEKTHTILAGELSPLQSRTHYIDYAESAAPDQYVDRVHSLSDLRETTPGQRTEAVENITPDLYRNRLDTLPEEERHWADKIGATDVYLKLRDRPR